MNDTRQNLVLDQPMPTEGLLPHGGTFQLLDEVLWVESDPIAGECSARLKEGRPYFTEDGHFEDHWLIEFGAQASAVCYLLARRSRGEKPPRGYLISVREFVLKDSSPRRVGDVLRIRVRFEVESLPLGQSLCEILVDQEVIAEGEMTFLLDSEGEG